VKPNIEILLGEWGAWKRGENRSGLGYPDRSSFQCMRVDGLRRVELYDLMVDDDLLDLDESINLLFPDARLVVTAHYVWHGNVKDKLKRARLERSYYYRTLEVAHKQLSHLMGAKYQEPHYA